YPMRTSLRFQPFESLSSVPQRLAHLLISTEVKSTEARFGARASTARPTGRWSRRALRCRRPTAAPRRHPTHGARRSSGQRVPSVRSAPLSLFQRLAGRARLLETDFYAPMIRGEGVRRDPSWTELLAKDYLDPRYHISFARAVGRRLRRTYACVIQ